MEKQIEEMRKDVASIHRFFLEDDDYEILDDYIADMLYKIGYRRASEVAREILEEVDNVLHDMGIEYANAGHNTYFAVCEMVHHKVIRPIEKKYESEDTK